MHKTTQCNTMQYNGIQCVWMLRMWPKECGSAQNIKGTYIAEHRIFPARARNAELQSSFKMASGSCRLRSLSCPACVPAGPGMHCEETPAASWPAIGVPSFRCAPGANAHFSRRDTIPLPDRLWSPKNKRHRGTCVVWFQEVWRSSLPLDQSRSFRTRTHNSFWQNGSSSHHRANMPWALCRGRYALKAGCPRGWVS